jgi:hypothetical protein
LNGEAESDEALVERFQRAAFDYFLKECNRANGLVADTSRAGAPASIAVVGFALSSYAVGVERGWMPRSAAAARVLATLRFFWSSPQSEAQDATGHMGFYYHFLDMRSGRRAWQSELSLIDSALLLAGVLVAGVYFDAHTPAEEEIRTLADALYRRVNWQWGSAGTATLRQGWKPDSGFIHYGWEGYSEATLLYVLALASPTFPLAADCYGAWTATYQWENIYDYEYLYAGPLFIHQFSHAWIDFVGIRDKFMHEKRSDYFENSRRATCVQREFAQRNPHGYAGYAENCWGISASDGPGFKSLRVDRGERRFFGYAARGTPFGPDDGTLAPGATLASLPFAPQIVLAALRELCTRYPQMTQTSRLPSGFNPTLPGEGPQGWVSEGYFGLDQGAIVVMIENYRSQLLWRLMRRCPYIAAGLRRAGFTGGWLA